MKEKAIFLLIVVSLLFAACAPQTDSLLPPGEGPGMRETAAPAPTPTPVAVDGIAAVDGTLYLFDETAQAWTALPELDADFARVMVTEDGRIVALDENGAEAYALDMTTGAWVEVKITYTPEELAEMSGDEKLAAAPDKDGLTKYQPPNRPDTVLYRDADGGDPQWGYDLKTGEMFEVMDVSFNPDKPTVLTQADFDSGKWLESERLMCDQLPDTAQTPEWKTQAHSGFAKYVFLNGNPLYLVNPETKPQNICSFAQMELDFGDGPEQFILMGVVTKNADGSQRILHLLIEEKGFNFSNLTKNRALGFLIALVDESTDSQKRGLSGFRDVILKDSRMLEWGLELAKTGIITEEMERAILAYHSKPLGIEDKTPSD